MNYKTLSVILGVTTAVFAIGFAYLYINQPNRGGVQAPIVESQQNETPREVEEKPTETVKSEPWKLVSGDPSDTCTSPTFTGKTTIKGWYSLETNYIEKQWLFRVSLSELSKLPVDKLTNGEKPLTKFYEESPYFSLVNPTKELEAKLKQATEQNPLEITATKFTQYCEGRGMITIQ